MSGPVTQEEFETASRMLENYVGADAFRAGIRAYMVSHAYGNTTTAAPNITH